MSESEKSEIQVPIRKRSAIKGQVTKFYNYLQEISKNTPISSLQSKEIVLKIEKFQTLLSTFDTLQTEIELNCSDLEEQLAERELIEEKFHKCIALAQEINESASVSKTEHQKHESEYGSVNNSQCSHRFSSVKLPTIKLPSFDGNYLKWLEFRDTFDSLINSNENIPNINKFHYLRSSLEGGALVVIKSIEFTSNNYKVAWDLVCQRYNNKNLLINNHLKALFNIEALTRESHKALRFLIDLVSKNLRALNTLGQPTDKWDALIIYMVSTKLDSTTSRKWEELKNGLPELPTLEQFNDFLRNRADVLETTQVQNISRNDNYKSQGPREQKYSNSKSFVSSMSNNNSYKKSCDICHESHHLHACSKFSDMSTEARLDTALKLKLCLNCLRSGHTAKHCFLKGSCKYCNKKHNSLLHKDSTVGCSSSSSNTNNNNLPSNTLPTTLSAVSASQVLLCTAIVEIVNPENNISYRARALLDTGSQSSFITNKFKIKLGLQTQCSNPIRIAGIGNVQCDITERCSLKLFSCIDKSFNLEMMCLVVPQITSSLPTLKVDVKSLGLPANIILADPEFHCPSDIDMLLGADVFWEIVGTQQIGLGRHRPILQSSKLGWLVTGPIGIGQSNLSHENSYINVLNCSIIKDDIHDSLQRFWEVEELPSNKISYTLEEQACENSFKQNTSRLPSGRFLVKMPLKESPEEALGDSYNIAKRRFFSLENKLDKNPNIKKHTQRHLQFILWREDTSLPLKVLQLNTVTYGTASAPFLSTRCLLQLAEECTDMSIANIIKNDFYYDDLSTGASTEDELLKIYNSVTEILSSASFPLRKIRTNCPKIFENDVNNNTLNLTKQSCIRFKGKTLQPIMGNLPNVRTNPSFPFYSCGTDFAGPFMISSRKGRGSRVSKCYLCLFVCLTTKAVHLELVSDLTTQGFLMCLRRFVSRRGKPYEIYSDNGKTFVGANNELGRVLKSSREAVTEYGSTEGIRFKFSPAYSPHFGGIWEAGVKSSKHHLKRIAGNAALTFEELATLFTQIEAILNSRPLSPLSSDPTDLLPLTPGHFLIGRPLKSVPSLLIEKSRANRYERIEQLRQQFWERWRREYLAELQQRTKWRRPDRELKVGDLVILKEDNLPPLCWRLGRITKLYQGPDGVSRVADVLTSRGTVKRAVHKFCIIPGDDIDPNSTA
nr:uncharacterized protein LOC126054199 [Helicoverpa armigera]